MTISQVLCVLEKAVHFERIPHPKDTRANVIAVSNAGRTLAAEVMQVVEATDKAFFMPLGEKSLSLVALCQKLL
ncbi:hypothetical protein [Serratia fonticola]